MSNIKVTKRHHYDVEGDTFDAILKRDFYKSDPKRPYVLGIHHTKTKKRIESVLFETKDDALDYFCQFYEEKLNNTTTH